MIQPGDYDITIQQNGDFDMIFQFKDSAGDPINLTGSTVEAELWTEGKHAKLADFVVTIVDVLLGKVKISLTDATTAKLPESGYYDIRITDVYGNSYYWVRGQAIVAIGYTE